jgi:hypothetical protein
MGAAPGWYDAGVPGRLRWWDGSGWSPHETDTPTAPQAGWYPVPNGVLRWWDGRSWTGLRVKDGRPGIDWATTEQPVMVWVFGLLFFGLAVVQLGLGVLVSTVSPSGVTTLLLSGLWFAVAIQSSAVRRIPSPVEPPATIGAVRPLPGEVEGPDAGWYPVGSRTTRWWSGVRWAQYAGTPQGVRPTFHGARAIKTMFVMSWVLIGAGALAVIAGVVMLVPGAGAAADQLLGVIGLAVLLSGILLAGLGVLVLAMTFRHRRVLVPPSGPPSR